MTVERLQQNQVLELVERFKKSKEDVLIIGLRGMSHCDLVPLAKESQYPGEIALKVPIEDFITELARRHEIRGYKTNAKTNKDWYVSDNYRIAKVIRQTINEASYKKQRQQAKEERSAQEETVNMDKLRKQMVAQIYSYIYNTTTISLSLIEPAIEILLKDAIIEPYQGGGDPNKDLIQLSTFLSDEVNGSDADFVSMGVAKAFKGYRVTIPKGRCADYIIMVVDRNIRESAVYPERELATLERFKASLV